MRKLTGKILRNPSKSRGSAKKGGVEDQWTTSGPPVEDQWRTSGGRAEDSPNRRVETGESGTKWRGAG